MKPKIDSFKFCNPRVLGESPKIVKSQKWLGEGAQGILSPGSNFGGGAEPVFLLFFSYFVFFLFLSYFGPEARKLFCSRPTALGCRVWETEKFMHSTELSPTTKSLGPLGLYTQSGNCASTASCSLVARQERAADQACCYNRRKPKGDGGKETQKKLSRQFATNVTTIYDIYGNFRLFVPLT